MTRFSLSQEKLNEILRLHKMWVDKIEGGARASFRGSNIGNEWPYEGIEMGAFDFSNAYLPDAKMNNATMSGLCFRNADLTGVDFTGTRLTNCDFRDAKMINTKLMNVDLTAAKMVNVDLTGARFNNAYSPNVDFTNAKMINADFTGTFLNNSDFSNSNLRDARLVVSDVLGCDFSDADFRGTNILGTSLRYAILKGINLYKANLEKIKEDFFDILSQAVKEISYLEKAILEGGVDGLTYDGECICLCGILENAGNTEIKRNPLRPIERFFLAIRKEDTPENSQFSKIVMDWIQEFKAECREEGRVNELN